MFGQTARQVSEMHVTAIENKQQPCGKFKLASVRLVPDSEDSDESKLGQI